MTILTQRESKLVVLGAAIGSNCVPCIERHVPEARKVGLTDQEIRAAIELADAIRQVPVRNVLEAAMSLLADGADPDACGSHAAAGGGAAKGCC
jgi:AhpD family alkylhydroperoxidase